MTLQEQCELSYYARIAELNKEHGVYLVQHTQSKRVFVEKTLTNYDASVYRYLQSHRVPNTPYIYGLYENDHTLTVIEEYVGGRSLQAVLDEEGPLSTQAVVDITRQLCAILQCFHRAQPPIVHRDIKPSNIIISPDGVVTLLDLDAAKWFRGESSQDTKLIGTVGYAAPEQYGFGSSSAQTDIYALGVLINVMRCGAFPRDQLADGALGAIVTRCTKIDPSERYSSVDEIEAALDRAVITAEGSIVKDDVAGEFGIVKDGVPGEGSIGKGGASTEKALTLQMDGETASDKTTKKAREGWRSYLPPGFRSSPIIMFFSGIGYFLLFYFCFSMSFKDQTPMGERMYRYVTILLLLSLILFTGNYGNIWEKMHITRAKKRWQRVLLIALMDVGIVIVWVTILAAALESVK